MQNYNKGFTTIKVAVILMIAGSAFIIALKGKQLTEAAKIKAEVNKIYKLQSSLNIYMSQTNKSGGIRAYTGEIDSADFFNSKIISKNETKSMYGKISNSVKTYYFFSGCTLSDKNKGHLLPNGNAYKINSPTHYCADMYALADDFSDASPSSVILMPLHMQCGIETILDDKKLASGIGMRTDNSLLTNFSEKEYCDCFMLSASQATEQEEYRVVLY